MPSVDREMRLRAIAALQAGWMDGGGRSIDSQCIRSAREILAQLPEAENWCIFPTFEGGISLERQHEDRRLSILIEPEEDILVIDVSLDGDNEVWSVQSVSEAVEVVEVRGYDGSGEAKIGGSDGPVQLHRHLDHLVD